MKPRFTIAHILLFTTIVGLIIGWALDRAQLNKRYQANTVSLKHVLGDVNAYDTQIQYRRKQLSVKYSQDNSIDDTSYFHRECGELELEIERERQLFSKLLSPLAQTAIK